MHLLRMRGPGGRRAGRFSPLALPHHTNIFIAPSAGLEKRTGGCFGAVVVKNGEIVGESYNHVIAENVSSAGEGGLCRVTAVAPRAEE